MRYTTLDSWRGVCALLVVFYHANGTGIIGGSEFIRGAFLFVDFFFVLSGFVMSEAYLSRLASGHDFLVFLVRRWGRVWPLHAAMMLAFLSLELVKLAAVRTWGLQLANVPFTGTLAPEGFLPSLLLLHSMGLLSGLTWNVPSWSIAAEFWTYAVFGCLVWRIRRHVVLGAIVISLGAAVVLVMRSNVRMDATYELGFVRCLFGFFAGVLLHAVRHTWRSGSEAMGTGAEVVSIVLGAGFVATCHDNAFAYLSPVIFASVIFVFAGSDGAFSRLLRTRPFANLGLWSYSVYMTHVFLLGLVSMGAKALDRAARSLESAEAVRAVLSEPGMADVLVVAFGLIVVAVSSQTYRFIELPGQHLVNAWARSLGRSAQSAPT